MNDKNPAVMPDDDDPMTYAPLSCVTVTRDSGAPAPARGGVGGRERRAAAGLR